MTSSDKPHVVQVYYGNGNYDDKKEILGCGCATALLGAGCVVFIKIYTWLINLF